MDDVVLPKFNTYLSKKGDTPLNKFPGGSSRVNFNWIIKNKLTFTNGAIVMATL